MIPGPEPFSGTLWRIFFAHTQDLAPAAAPVGRFHHAGQSALYSSTSAQGAAIAIKRYVHQADPPRRIVSYTVTATRIVDLRRLPDPTRASVVWQDKQEAGQPSPTWAFSDAARASHAQGLLYPSRSRPDLTHLVLFDWTSPDGAQLRLSSPPAPWPTDSGPFPS